MADIEIAALTDGSVIQDTDLFVVSRAGAGRKISGDRFVRTNGAGDSLISGDGIVDPTHFVRSGTAKVLGGDGGANSVLYSGTTALLVRNAGDTSTLLTITNGGAISATGTLAITGAITQNGNQVWHAGNLTPSLYMPKTGGTFTGGVLQTGGSYVRVEGLGGGAPAGATGVGAEIYATGGAANFTGWNVTTTAAAPVNVIGDTVTIKAGAANVTVAVVGATGVAVTGTFAASGAITQGGNQVWHAGNLTPSDYMPKTGGTFTGGITGTTAAFSGAITQAGNQVWHAGNFDPTSKAPLASPALTGTPTAPTAAGGTNTTQIATTAFVSSAIGTLIGAAPGLLDTLEEIADALGDDPNFATTMTTALAGKQASLGYTPANKAGDTFTGGIAGTTATFSGAVSTAALTATSGTFSGAVSTVGLTGTTGTFSGAFSTAALTATSGTFTGPISAKATTVGASGWYMAGTFTADADPMIRLGSVTANIYSSIGSGSDGTLYVLVNGTSGAIGTTAITITPAGAITLGSSLTAAGAIKRDANFGLDLVGGNARVTFDAGDYLEYDRTANKLILYVASTAVASIDSSGNIRTKADIFINQASV